MPRTLKILLWPDYVDPQNIAQFESETSTHVTLKTIPSAVELMERVHSGDNYDILVPPDYSVRELIAEGRLVELDPARLPHLSHIGAEFLTGRAHDPGSRFSVPKDWGTTGFMYREDKIAERPASWRDFWSLAARYSSKVTVLDSPGEVIGAALKMGGHSYNSMREDELRQARTDLIALWPHVRRETDYRPLLTSGEAWMSLGWNGDAFALRSKGIPIRYVVPAEGSQRWEDSWAISSNCTQTDLAHAFIDFMLRPDVALREAQYTGYATPNQTAFERLSDSVRGDPSVYPPLEIIDKLEWGLPTGDDGPVIRDFSLID